MANSAIKIAVFLAHCAGYLALPPPQDQLQDLRGLHGQHVWSPEYFPTSEEILSRPTGRPFTIAVEGNVGSGKSTLLNFFNGYPDIAVYQEPVDKWMNMNGSDFLGLVYQNQSRWGMAFESLVQQTMLDVHLSEHRSKDGNITAPVKIMERSIQSSENVFVRQIRTKIHPDETKVLLSWYDLMNKHEALDVKVDLVLYLRTVPEVIFQRVAKRNRPEEMKIPLEYYQVIHRYHEDWLIHKNVTGSKYLPRVLVLDANRDISELKYTYRYLAKDIYQSIPKQLRTDTYFKGNSEDK